MRFLSTIFGLVLCTILLIIFLFSPVTSGHVLAQVSQDHRTQAFKELRTALDEDTDGVFTQYSQYYTRLKDENLQAQAVAEFDTEVLKWSKDFETTKLVYSRYSGDPDPEISGIASTALQAVDKGIQATNLYLQANQATTQTQIDSLLGQGDALFTESVTGHDEAIGLYNKYSGASDAATTKNWLIVGSIISSLFSIIIFMKSRPKSQLNAEILRSSVYSKLLKSSLWMTAGIVITTVGYVNALNNGGTYYILWGAMVFGGYQLIKGLYVYFTQGRVALDKLAVQENGGAIKSRYETNASETKEVETESIRKHIQKPSETPGNTLHFCDNCGHRLKVGSEYCTKCGSKVSST